MSVNYVDFNTGSDLTVTITDNATSAQVSFGGFITSSEQTSKHDIITIKPIDAPTYVNRIAYGNYEGTIMVARATGDLDDLEAQNLQDFISSGTNHRYTVTGSILNQADGSYDEYQLLNCLLYVESFGDFKRDAEVSMKINLVATQRVKAA